MQKTAQPDEGAVGDICKLLRAWSDGEQGALEKLTPSFMTSYQEFLKPRRNSQSCSRDIGNRLAAIKGMKERSLTLPEIGLIASTRVALGAGIGLLISERFNKDQRKAAGWALLGMGIVTTVPIVAGILGKGPFARKPIGLAA